MLDELARTAIDRAVLCWLATADGRGRPNVSPKEVFCAGADGELLIAEIASPASLRNIVANPAVCVSMADVFVQKGCKIEGCARVVRRGDAGFASLAAPLVAMAGPDFPVRAVIVVQAERISPIAAPSYARFPGRCEAEQVARAHRTYGVRPLGDPRRA